MFIIVTLDTTNVCDMKNGGCEQICTASQNSGTCSCHPGYLLNSDAVSCAGIRYLYLLALIILTTYVL